MGWGGVVSHERDSGKGIVTTTTSRLETGTTGLEQTGHRGRGQTRTRETQEGRGTSLIKGDIGTVGDTIGFGPVHGEREQPVSFYGKGSNNGLEVVSGVRRGTQNRFH